MVFLGTPTLTLPPSLNAVKPDFASVTREFSFLFNCEFRAGVPGVVILTPDLGVAKGGLLFAALTAALASAALTEFLLDVAAVAAPAFLPLTVETIALRALALALALKLPEEPIPEPPS